MKKHWAIAAVLTLALQIGTGCSPLLIPTPPPVLPEETFTPVPASFTPESSAAITPSPGPFELDLTPLPSPTALATLTLPTQPADAQGIQVWDGLPTYPAESRPDFYFRVSYDPAAWALTIDQFGYPVLASRSLTGCVLTPSAGRGLPPSGTVEHEVRGIGAVTFQVSRASVGGAAEFVNYAGGDGLIYTAFEVSFEAQPEPCIAAAEGVLGTLTSVPRTAATPASGH